MIDIDWFWKLTDDDIIEALTVRNNKEILSGRGVRLVDAAWHYAFPTLTKWLYECENDRILMRLRYSDEINALISVKQMRSPGVSVTVIDD